MAPSMLRPLGLGEILDAGIKVVTRNWKPLIGAQLVITAPVWILFVLLIASVDSTAFEIFPEETATTEDPSASLAVGLLASVVLLIVGFLVSFVALFKGVCDAWLGVKPSVKRMLSFAMRRLGWVFVLSIVWWVPMLVFMLPCGIPALWLGTVWSLSLPALLFERTGPVKALGRSFGLIQGRFWESLLIVFVCVALTYVISNAVQLPLLAVVAVASSDNGIANAIAQGVGATLGSAVTYPYMAAVLTILYFDQRVRKEGFDIQLLAQGLGVDRDPDADLPAPLVAPPGAYGPPPAGYGPPPPGYGAPSPGSGPPPQGWSSPSGWSAPTPSRADPPLWGSGQSPSRPPDDRPPSDSPWMTPAGSPLPPSGRSPADAAPPGATSPEDEPAAPTGPTPDDASSPGGAASPGGSAPGESAPGSAPGGSAPGGSSSGGSAPGGDPASSAPGGGPHGAVPATGWSGTRPPGAEEDDDEKKRKRDRNRADWLPPDSPRGPGGL